MIIKRFNEDLNYGFPQVGDVVICTTYNKNEIELNDYTTNNIGKLVHIVTNSDQPYVISYNNLPSNLRAYISKLNDNSGIQFELKEIIYWSKNKEDLEMILKSKKFNI